MKIQSGSFQIQVLPSPTLKARQGAKNKGKYLVKPFQRELGREMVLAGLLTRFYAGQDRSILMLGWFTRYGIVSLVLAVLNRTYCHSVDLALDALIQMISSDHNLTYAIDRDWVNGWLVMLLDIHH